MNGDRHDFQAGANAVCRRVPKLQPETRHRVTAEVVLPEPEEWCYQESFAQVESLVVPNSGCGLKPDGSTKMVVPLGSTTRERPDPLSVRFSAIELETVKAKAKAVGCSTNSYIRASALGSDYRPPADPELTRALLRIYRELNAQGNNVNQIARQLNGGLVLPGQGSVLDALSLSLQETLRDVRDALASGGPGVGV